MNLPPPGEPPAPPEKTCPNCGAGLPLPAVLCVACGYDFQAGRQLETVREPLLAEALLRPPVREPRDDRLPDESLAAPVRKRELEKSLDLETRVFWLEERVRELERRVGGTRLTAPDLATRSFVVFGHWLVAALALGFCFGSLAALLGLLARLGW